MHSLNTFKRYPPSQTVDQILGTSYEVVKAVYCQLDALVALTAQIPEIQDKFLILNDIYKLKEQIKVIGDNFEEILKAPQYIQQLKNNTVEGKKELTATKEALVKELSNTKDTLDSKFTLELSEKKNQIIAEANQAMFSFRFYALKLIPFTQGHLEYLQPKVNVKPHDHVIDVNGDVYEIDSVDEATFTISGLVTSIKGSKGDKGNIGPKGQDGAPGVQGPQGPQGIPGVKGDPGAGLKILAEFATVGDLTAAHPEGTPGECYLVKGSVYFWDNIKNAWKDTGILQGPEGKQGAQGMQGPQGIPGPKGETGDIGLPGPMGPSLLEVSMNPDPTNNFNKHYK